MCMKQIKPHTHANDTSNYECQPTLFNVLQIQIKVEMRGMFWELFQVIFFNLSSETH